MKVVVTSTALEFGDDDLLPLATSGISVVMIDGTDRATLVEHTRDADALIVLAESIDRELIEGMTRCRSITRLGVGVDTVDIEAATERGIWVTNVPDANYREVAVHAIALALAVTRRLPALDRGIRSDGWTSSVVSGVHRPDTQTFGLVGLGRIGRRAAEMAVALGYRVVAHDPAASPGDTAALGVELLGLREVIARSNVLSLHVPLLDGTRNLIDAEAIARMPRGAVLINVSRGGLVDEHALAAALESGQLFGAGLDVFEHEPLELSSPLRQLDSVILSPHAGHWSEESWAETKRKAVEEAARVLRGERPRYPVNAPGAASAA
jgi:D-3-phosphoglycerate dehydrogenase